MRWAEPSSCFPGNPRAAGKRNSQVFPPHPARHCAWPAAAAAGEPAPRWCPRGRCPGLGKTPQKGRRSLSRRPAKSRERGVGGRGGVWVWEASKQDTKWELDSFLELCLPNSHEIPAGNARSGLITWLLSLVYFLQSHSGAGFVPCVGTSTSKQLTQDEGREREWFWLSLLKKIEKIGWKTADSNPMPPWSHPFYSKTA